MSTPSLLLVPARLKDGTLFSQIPTNGSGDFTVVQAVGNATRVNASGFVESAKTNLLQQSEEFENVYWSKALGVVTQNQTTAPDGLTTADKYVVNNGQPSNSPIIRLVTFATNTTYTLSLFVKKADYDTASIRLNTTETGLIINSFNLASGTATNNQIQDYGNGWYRVWVSFTTAATVTNGQVQLIRGAEVRDGVAGIFIWGAQLEVGSSPSDYIPTTTVARTKFSGVTVNGTSIANVPRLDYYTSSGTPGCPGLLVEASGSNLAFNSQTWDASNNWQLSDGSGRVTVATATSGTLAPDGTSTANAITPTSGNIQHYLYSNATGTISYVSGTVYTLSAFFKKGSGNSGRYIQIATANLRFLGNPYANFDLELGTTLTVSGSVADSNRVSRIENYGNGWYRCSLTATCGSAGSTAVGIIAVLLTADTNARAGTAFAGNTSDYIFGWGAQLETGSVATSYIPTTTGSVTRNADVISVSGAVSGSIGQASGTLYAEVDVRNITAGKNILSTDDGNSLNRVSLFIDPSPNRITAVISSVGTGTFVSGSVTAGVHKIAVSYASGDVQVFLNGAFLASGVPTLFPSVTRNNLSIGGRIVSGVYGAFLNDRIRAAALYTTRLTNDQLAALTTP